MSTYRLLAPLVLALSALALLGCGNGAKKVDHGDKLGTVAWTDTYAQAFETAEETGQGVMLVFWKPGENQSEFLLDDAMEHKPITDQLTDFVPVSIIMNSPATIQLSIRHEVKSIPSTIFMNADGEEIGRVEGYGGIDWYLDELSAALEGS
ncbi:MAG: hypothetical protein IH944_13405 [Armatimonadetes bacterium]|nr:hypothetical protein [Armatimonadota bacterium]